MNPQQDFKKILTRHGSDVIFHRDDSVEPCPCRDPDGSRNPLWHLEHPDEPVCNEIGMLPGDDTTTDVVVKAFMQPVQSGAVRRLTDEQLLSRFGGTIETDDHTGLFPLSWGSTTLDFTNWSEGTEDYIEYGGRKFTVVSVNLIPDPSNGKPHHWETGLRLLG